MKNTFCLSDNKVQMRKEFLKKKLSSNKFSSNNFNLYDSYVVSTDNQK